MQQTTFGMLKGAWGNAECFKRLKGKQAWLDFNCFLEVGGAFGSLSLLLKYYEKNKKLGDIWLADTLAAREGNTSEGERQTTAEGSQPRLSFISLPMEQQTLAWAIY